MKGLREMMETKEEQAMGASCGGGETPRERSKASIDTVPSSLMDKLFSSRPLNPPSSKSAQVFLNRGSTANSRSKEETFKDSNVLAKVSTAAAFLRAGL